MLKKIVSLMLFFSLFLMMLTALVVYIAPASRVASWSDWTFLGLSLAHWQGAHLGMGLLFLVLGLVHLGCNWDALLDHLRDADGVVVIFTKPFFIGLALTLVCFIWALAELPPVHQFVSLSHYFKQRAVVTYGEPPYALAERSTLADLARRMGMDGEKALALLRLKNIKADSADLTLTEIARQNGVAPGGVFDALKMVQEPSGGETSGLPKDPPPGLGRRRLADICEEYGLSQAEALRRLEAAGLKARPAWTLTEVAKANGMLPIAVYEALRGEKPMTSVVVEPPQAVTPVTPEAVPEPEHAASAAPERTAPVEPGKTPDKAPVRPHEIPVVATPSTPPVATTPVVPEVAPATPAPVPPVAAQPGYGQPAPLPQSPGTVASAPAPSQPALPATTPPTAPPPGLEKMMLQTFCRQYGLPLSVAVQRLARHNITAFGDMTFTELSLENNRSPAEIMHLVLAR